MVVLVSFLVPATPEGSAAAEEMVWLGFDFSNADMFRADRFSEDFNQNMLVIISSAN